MTDTKSPVEVVVKRFQRGLYDTVEEALACPLLTTDEEREQVREALTPDE